MQNDNQINKAKLRAELEDIRKRIEDKITQIVYTHQKLPFDRLSKGRQLKELVIMTIIAVDDGNENAVIQYILELKKKGVLFKNKTE